MGSTPGDVWPQNPRKGGPFFPHMSHSPVRGGGLGGAWGGGHSSSCHLELISHSHHTHFLWPFFSPIFLSSSSAQSLHELSTADEGSQGGRGGYESGRGYQFSHSSTPEASTPGLSLDGTSTDGKSTDGCSSMGDC